MTLNLTRVGLAFCLGMMIAQAALNADTFTWTEHHTPGYADNAWKCMASSSDGMKLIAGIDGGGLYTSSDSGATWAERRPAGDVARRWSCAAMSADGTRLVVADIYSGAGFGRVYTSVDSGATWTERQPAGSYGNSTSPGIREGPGPNASPRAMRIRSGPEWPCHPTAGRLWPEFTGVGFTFPKIRE